MERPVINEITSMLTLPGDIGFSSGNGWLAKSIRWFQSVWTNDAKWSHVWAVVGGSMVVEALGKISYNPISKYNNQTICVYRIPLSNEERERFAIGMIRRVNGAYGWLKYPLFVADSATTWVKQKIFRMGRPCFFFTRVFGISNIPVCSQLIVWGLHEFTSYRIKDDLDQTINWRIASPDYLNDLMQLPINRAVIIFEHVANNKQ